MNRQDTISGRELPPFLVILLAVSAGAAVANIYYSQAFLGQLVDRMALTAGSVAMVPVLTQMGNALGIIFLAPLGDRLERKSLILATIALLVFALVGAALSPGFSWLLLASFVVGLFATVVQQIVPLAIQIAGPTEKGAVLGKVTGGILVGILLARTLSGFISDRWGWPPVFWFAAALMTLIGLALARWLPRVPPTTSLGYARLIGSLWELLRTHRALRKAITVQFLIFAGFMAFWANLALLLAQPDYRLGGTAVGLLALVGVAGALAAPIAGRIADRHGPAMIVSLGALLVAVAFTLMVLWQGSLMGLVAGILILDLAVQSSQVANQTLVYAIEPTASSRLNTMFMATMIAGGAFGAGIGGAAYAAFGWTGTCIFGLASAILALVLSRRG